MITRSKRFLTEGQGIIQRDFRFSVPKLTFDREEIANIPNNLWYNVGDFEFLSPPLAVSVGALACFSLRLRSLFFLFLLSLRRKARGGPRVPWSVFAWRLRCGGSEFALILAMLLRPCLGQAMVCMVVLSAAALASQTHYSYLNEFSLLPPTLLLRVPAPIPLLLSPRQLCILWPRSFLSTTDCFCNNEPESFFLSFSLFPVCFIDSTVRPLSRSASLASYMIRIHRVFCNKRLGYENFSKTENIMRVNACERFYASLAQECTLLLYVIIYDNKISISCARSMYIESHLPDARRDT